MMIQQIQMNQEELKRFSSQRTANLVLANQKRAANAGPASQPRVLQRLAVPKPPTTHISKVEVLHHQMNKVHARFGV
jgi:hypothetical protein